VVDVLSVCALIISQLVPNINEGNELPTLNGGVNGTDIGLIGWQDLAPLILRFLENETVSGSALIATPYMLM
jgi:hypothetical protein